VAETQWAGAYPITTSAGAIKTTNMGYQSDDINELAAKTIHLLKHPDELRASIAEVQQKAYTDQIVAPVLSSDVASKTADYVNSGGRGLIHVCGDAYISKYEWAINLADEFGYSSEYVIPTDRKKDPQSAPRPKNGCLKSTFKVTNYEESLERFHELF